MNYLLDDIFWYDSDAEFKRVDISAKGTVYATMKNCSGERTISRECLIKRIRQREICHMDTTEENIALEAIKGLEK